MPSVVRISVATDASPSDPTAEYPDPRMGQDGCQHLAFGAGRRRPGPDRYQDGETFEPVEEVGQPAKRGDIGPMGVVHRQQERVQAARLAASQ